MSEVKDVIVQGLWKNNSALVQLLGMCPLLAVTSTATNALGLGLATTIETLAQAEQLTAHKNAVTLRVNALKEQGQ